MSWVVVDGAHLARLVWAVDGPPNAPVLALSSSLGTKI